MKIDKPLQSVTTTSVNSDGKKRADNIPDPNTATENNVHLSSSVTRLQNIETSSTINTTQIQGIKQAINEGNFQVNPEVVADRLLEAVKELIQSKKGSI